MKKAVLIIVLLFALTSVASAQGPSPIQCFTGQMYGRDLVIALAVLMMFLIVGLAYMAAGFMHKPEWEAWAKTEMYQVVVSCVLAASIITIADVSCWASWDLSGGKDAIAVTENFLSRNYEESVSLVTWLYRLKAVIDFMAELHIMAATNPLFIVPMYPGFSAVSQNINVVMGIISILAGNLMVQQIVFELIKQTAFPIFLPLGLVLRVFPVTRDAGSFLIAVAFGLYIIFPLTYVLADEVMRSLPSERTANILIPVIGGVPGVPAIPAFWLPAPGKLGIINIFGGPLRLFFILTRNLNFVLAATFFPALNMTITITFIKSLSKALIHHLG